MTTRTIDIPEELARFIHDSVAAGRYPDENEVVRAALHLLEREEVEYRENLVELRAEVQKGVDAIKAGDYIELNSREDIQALGRDISRRGTEGIEKEKASNQWPDGYFETVFGGWQGDPLLRPEQGEFEQREPFN
jgi:putative addiction module CopG family antidote